MRRWVRQLLFRLRPLRSKDRVHREIDDEVEFHLQMETERWIRKGLDPKEARRRALVDFGGEERFKEAVREVDGVSLLERGWGDLRYGLRILRRSPVFTSTALLTLALGIGASTSIFSVVDGILLRSLPFPNSNRLVTAWADETPRGGPLREWFSYPDFHDLRNSTDIFEELAVYTDLTVTLTEDGETAEQITGIAVSYGMLSRVLEVQPAIGRAFRPEDDVPGVPPVALLSHGFWSRRFGSDPDAVGRSITLNGVGTTVIGVMPEGFRAPFQENADYWTPAQIDITTASGRGNVFLRTIGRLEEGVSFEAAQAEARLFGSRLEQEYPETNFGRSFVLFPLQDDLVATASTGLWILMGAVGFVLLLICVNVANLMIARGSAREGEFALRAALGAQRSRLRGQVLTEGLLIAVLGGMLGTVVALVGTDLLVTLAPPRTPRIHEVEVNARILTFSLAISLFAGVVFSLAPALRAAGTSLRKGLVRDGRGTGGGGRRAYSLQRWLVAGQMAMAMVLLVGAGLMLQSFQQLRTLDMGFDPDGVATFTFALPPARYADADALLAFHKALEQRLEGVPGIEAAGMTSTLPLSGNNGDATFNIEGRPIPTQEEQVRHTAWVRRVSPGYMESMGMRMLAGRAFTEEDGRESSLVLVINETLAREHFVTEDPIGQRINFGSPENPTWREVVGVVRNVRNFGVRDEGRNATYLPYAQAPNRFASVVVKTTGDPLDIVPFVRREVAAIDPTIATPATNMESLVDNALSVDRFVTLLLSLFAGVALVLAAVGLYGVVAYGVTRRLREIGIRIALGAEERQVGAKIVGQTITLALTGVGIGCIGVFGVTRFLEGLLYDVNPIDPTTLLSTTFVLVAAAALASAVPAMRAVRVDPIRVLTSE